MSSTESPVFKFAIREDLLDTGDLFLPKKSEQHATGYDVFFAPPDRQSLTIKPGEYVKLPLGFRSFCPPGWYYNLHPRSSTFIKKNLHSLIGIIDETWEGETALVTQLHSSTDLIVKFAEPIAQIIPRKREDMVPIDIDNDIFNSLCKDRHSERGDGGFGSSKDVKLIIYKIINKINKKIYIGQTTRTLEERKKSYKYEKGRPIAHAIKKYGFENFDFQINDTATNMKDLNDKEEEWIEKTNARHKGIGYNIAFGGLNCLASKETKEKISKASSGSKNGFYGRKHTAETKEKFKHRSSWWYGKKHTEETKKKMSKAQKGLKKPEEAVKKRIKLNAEEVNKVIKLYKKGHIYSYMAKKFNVSNSTIGNIIRKYNKDS